jgi:hypothetical protein
MNTPLSPIEKRAEPAHSAAITLRIRRPHAPSYARPQPINKRTTTPEAKPTAPSTPLAIKGPRVREAVARIEAATPVTPQRNRELVFSGQS